MLDAELNVIEFPSHLKNLIAKFPLLPETAKKLIAAIADELGSPEGFTPRHKLNDVSRSFPYNFRTMANRDASKTGPKEKILVGKHMMYRNLSLLELLCEDLTRKEGGIQ